MKALELEVSDVLWNSAGDPHTDVRLIPLVRDRIGPAWDCILTEIAGNYPFPSRLLGNLVDPLAAHLGPDLALPALLTPRDLVLLDQNPHLRANPSGEGDLWVVQEGSHICVRYVAVSAAHVLLSNEVTRRQPEHWRSVPLAGQNILEIVRAKIVWIGREVEREMERPASGPPEPSGSRHRSDW